MEVKIARESPSLFISTRASLGVQSIGNATEPLARFGHGCQLVKIKFIIMKDGHM